MSDLADQLEAGDIAGPIKVTLRRNADGVERTVSVDLPWNGDYWWREGNASCDCNRRNFFAEAAGEPRDFVTEGRCGDGGFTVLSITIPDGTVVYKEAPP